MFAYTRQLPSVDEPGRSSTRIVGMGPLCCGMQISVTYRIHYSDCLRMFQNLVRWGGGGGDHMSVDHDSQVCLTH